MQAVLVLLFVVVFGVVLLTMRAGQKYFANRQKQRVAEMLQGPDAAKVRLETKILKEGGDRDRSALDDVLKKLNFFRTAEADLQQSGLAMSLTALVAQMTILMIPGVFIGLRLNPLMYPALTGAGCAFALATLPYLRVRRARNKRLRAFEQQFPEALDFLARAMRAGHAFSISLEMLSEETPPPLGQEFRKVFSEHNLGLPIETALGNLVSRVPLIDVSFFVSAVLLQRETGGNLSEILTKLAAVIRDRFKIKGQVAAASAHGRITGTILTLMPVALMLGLMIVAPRYLKSMADDPDGRLLIGGAIIGILLGHYCIRRIIDIKV